jgi:hypothetical protein
MTSDTILVLLRERHAGDVFVGECKDGPTAFGSHCRLDAWAMKKSWANPCMSGYEIKISRSDFLKDDKWPSYLPLCNQFWFAAAPGVIEPQEVPPGAGLLVVASTGRMLRTIKKAPYREVEAPVDLYRYILMHRTKVVAQFCHEEDPQERADFWRRWLAEKDERMRLGIQVGKRLRETFATQVAEVQESNRRLKEENSRLQEVAALLRELKIDPRGWHTVDKVRKSLTEVIPEHVESDLRRAYSALDGVLRSIDSERGMV